MSGRDELLARFDALLDEARALDDEALITELRARLEPQAPPAEAIAAADEWHGMIGSCPPLLEIRKKAERFANASVPILIEGESGTGKDVVANILHRIGSRSGHPFISENCAAIPENLLESVLFGHKKGSFTGAIRNHDGHFVAAHKGSLFLDEIGDMPLPMQAKLLRVLQEGEVRPVGGTSVRRVDVRILAATNQDIEEMVRQGRFREDLYYRLNVLRLYLPPLRERGADVLLLARAFLIEACDRSGRSLTFAPDAESALARAAWPGNVRQLQNEIQRASVLAHGPQITAADLSAEIS